MKLLQTLATFLFILLLYNNIHAQKMDFNEIKSEGDWINVLHRADSLNKPVFLDIYATWCGPCKQMDNLVFANAEVAGFYNENFVNSKIDGESEFGIKLAREFELRGYPTMYYLAADNFLYANLVGFRPAEAFLEYGKKVDSSKVQLREFDAAFQNGTLQGESVRSYLDLLTELDVKSKLTELANLYINTLGEEDISNPENKGLILNSSLTFESDPFRYILSDPEKFAGIWGEEEYQNFLEKVFQEALNRAANNNDLELRDRLGTELMSVYFRNDPASVEYGKFLTRKLYHAISGNWEGYIEEVNSYLVNEKQGDGSFLVQEVYQVLRNQYSSNDLLIAANKWVEIILKDKKSFEPYYLSSIINVYLEDLDTANKMIDEAEKLANPEEMETLEGVKRFIIEKSQNQETQ